MTIANLLDLDHYPLDRLESGEAQALVARCRSDLHARGMFNLPGLVRPEVLQSTVAELEPLFATQAFVHARKHNIYFKKDIPGLPPDHPALREVTTSNRTVCADQMPADAAVLTIYQWAPLAAFLARVMDKPCLYTMADPLARVNVMSYGAGETLNWHFDRSEFTTTLLLQAPESGGAFEYRTDLRTDTDPNYDGVAKLLAGEDPLARIEPLTAGTLNVFRGKNTAHRVTTVEGSRPRIIAVFSYYERPGVMFSTEERVGFYGRAA